MTLGTSANRKALIIVENNSVPFDRRVWREATSLHNAGWHVSVICPRSQNDNRFVRPDSQACDFEVLDGIHIYRFPLTFAVQGVLEYLREYFTAFIRVARLSWQVHRDEGFHTIQVCNPPDIFFPIGIFYRLMGKKFIFDHHDLFPEGITVRFSGSTRQILLRIALLLELLTFRMANVVMSTNESYRRIAMERGGVSPQRIFVVRNGPESASFQPIKADPALNNGLRYLVCYLGVMGVEDGIKPMLESIRFVVDKLGRRDVRFVLIGDGPMRPSGLSLLANWGLENQVLMPGRLPEQAVKSYLSTADLCLSPDPLTPLNDKSTMNKVMEYMVMGKPLVSFDLKEARHSAQDAAAYVRCGDIRAFGQAIVDLLDDPDRRARMGAIGRQRVLSELAWEHQKPYLLAAYARALGPN